MGHSGRVGLALRALDSPFSSYVCVPECCGYRLKRASRPHLFLLVVMYSRFMGTGMHIQCDKALTNGSSVM